jgi:hypothetical protein
MWSRQGRYLQTDNQNESSHEISDDSGVIIVHLATSKNLTVKSKMFPHHNIPKYSWASPEGKKHN